MNERGFVLATVLWVIVVLASVTMATLTYARVEEDFARNRIVLARAAWAREACMELFLARADADPAARTTDTVPLGNTLWCVATAYDPDARIDVNRASDDLVRAVVADPEIADAILDWRDPDNAPRAAGAERLWYAQHARTGPANRPIADLDELAAIRGIDAAILRRLERILTTAGSGYVELNEAPAEILRALPGISPIGAEMLVSARSNGVTFARLEDMLPYLSMTDRRALQEATPALLSMVRFRTDRLVVDVTGGVGASGARAVARVILTRSDGRWHVAHQEVE